MIKYAVALLALVSVGLGGYGTYQTNRANKLEIDVTRLTSQVESYKEGIKLQAELREKNFELTRELDSIRLEIQNAEGAKTPLLDDIRTLVERVRDGNRE